MILKNVQKLFLTIAGFLISIFPFSVFGLAQSVQPIVVENAQRGESYEATLSVFNTENKAVDIYFRASDDVETWASFFDINDTERKEEIKSLNVEPQSYGYALVSFKIPDFVANGEYKGNVIAGTKPNEASNENTAQIGFEVPREVTIKVGGSQILLYAVEILAGNIFLESGETFDFTVVYHNEGNVNIKPVVKFKATNNGNEITNIIFPYPDGNVAIAPASSRRMNYSWTPPAAAKSSTSYEISITPIVGDKEIKTETFTISINNASQAGVALANASFPAQGGSILYVAIGIGILILVIVVIIIKKIRRNKNQSI